MKTTKKRNFVYLAGNISDDPRTYEWRDTFIELTRDELQIVSVNPCGNAFNRAVLETSGDARVKMIEASQHILRAKDYQMVKISSLVVANIELCGERPLIGTIQELGWCRDIFNVPVIAICGKEPNPYTVHPWIDECISLRVETVEEAATKVKFYFLDY